MSPFLPLSPFLPRRRYIGKPAQVQPQEELSQASLVHDLHRCWYHGNHKKLSPIPAVSARQVIVYDRRHFSPEPASSCAAPRRSSKFCVSRLPAVCACWRCSNYEEFRLGYDALTANQNDQAVKYLKRAASYRFPDATAWFDLGIACQRLGRNAEAANAYRRALALDPESQQYQSALRSVPDNERRGD